MINIKNNARKVLALSAVLYSGCNLSGERDNMEQEPEEMVNMMNF